MSSWDKIQVLHGDITKLHVDAIVNAANPGLMGGGGVDGAIHRAGGPAIAEACHQVVDRLGPCATGSAVVTTAGRLPCRWLIHTVGPVWRGGHHNEAELLAQCYYRSLQLADEYQCRSIAFPNISTGVYGFPKTEAAIIAVQSVGQYLQGPTHIERVIFVCFEMQNYHVMLTQLEQQRS